MLVDNPLAAPDADGVERTENLTTAQVATPQLPFHAPLPPLPEEDVVPTQEVALESLLSGEGLMLKHEGKTYPVKDLATIQRWILERRVLRQDLLSRDGSRWEPAQSYSELGIFFSTIEDLERLEAAPVEAPVVGSPMPPLPRDVPMGNALADRPFGLGSGAELADAFALEGEGPSDATEEFFDSGPVMLFVPPVSPDSPFDWENAGPDPSAEQGAAEEWPERESSSEPEYSDEQDLPSEPSVSEARSPDDFFDSEHFHNPEPRHPPERRSPALLIILLGCLVLAVVLALTSMGVDADNLRPRRPRHGADVVEPPKPVPPSEPVVAPSEPVVAPSEPVVPPSEPVVPPNPPVEAPKPEAPPPVAKASASALADQGWEANADRRYAEADRLFKAALAVKRNYPLALYGQGYAAQQRGDNASAIRSYCAALQYGASDADIRRDVTALINGLGASCD